MDSDQQEAFMALQTASCGLEETFISAANDFVLTDEMEEYARSACERILKALDVIRSDKLNMDSD